MDEAAVSGDVGRPPPPRGDVDRIEALEQQVRQLTSRLAGWVEAQMVQALDDRRNEMKALRAELQVALHEQLVGMRAESESILSVASRRLEVAQAQMAERLDTVTERAADLAAARDRDRTDIEALRTELFSSLKAEADVGPARVEAFEQRVKAAMARLTDSVETRLTEALTERNAGLDALRREIVGRLETVHQEAARTGDVVAETERAVRAGGERTDVLEQQMKDRTDEMEQRVKAAVGRLTDSVETRLTEALTERNAGLDALRREIVGRLETVHQEAARTGDVVAETERAVRAGGERTDVLEQQMKDRTDELEQRVKAAVGRLAESVEERLAEQATAQQGRFVQVHERVQAVEQRHGEAQERLDEALEVKLGEVVERRRAEFDSIKEELEQALAGQMKSARTEIATAVAEAHRRFIVSVDQLHERMNVVADQATAAHAAATQIVTLQETVTSDGRRIEALEVHTRRTDARLGDVVDAKLSELATTRDATLEGVQAQMRAALDAHLAETRAEVTLALAEGRQELIEGALLLEERQARLDRQADEAVAGLDALGASAEAALRAAEERLADSVHAKLAELEAVAAQVAASRGEIDASVALVTRRVARVQVDVQKKVTAVVEQMDALAGEAAKEAGTLAPLRSDLRLLHAQVAELAESVAEIRPRRKAAAAPANKVTAAPAKKVTVAPANKVAVAPAKKKVAAAPAKKGAAAATKKVGRARRV